MTLKVTPLTKSWKIKFGQSKTTHYGHFTMTFAPESQV